MKTCAIDLKSSNKKIYSGHLRLGGTNPKGNKIGFTNYYMELNEKPFLAISGEFHYSRYPELYWEEEIMKMKSVGINIISTYVFWIHHEEEEGVFNWEGNRNLRAFIELCARFDMFVILRIGPFNHGEVRNGGLPDWLYGRPFSVRSNDKPYLLYVKRLYNQIFCQAQGLLFKDNGPVIGIQLENEYMSSAAPWEFMVTREYEWIEDKREGEAHLRALKDLATEAGFIVPMYTLTSWDKAPILQKETLPLSGGYSFCPWFINENSPEHKPTREYLMQSFHDNNYKSPNYKISYTPEEYPYSCCEIGGGMACWYKYRFIVSPESVEAATIVKIAGGCNFIGYYMFHDGTNPIGKHSYLNERVVPKLSYNFQAPLGEFGQLRTSCKALKPVFYFLKEFSESLCRMGTVLPAGTEEMLPEDTDTLRYAVRHKDNSGFIFLTNFQDHYKMKDHDNVSIKIDLYDETIYFPEGEGLTLKSGVSAILPFNLVLEDILIKYSTAQFITSINYCNTKYCFFFVPEGMEGEYLIASATVADFTYENCRNMEGLSEIKLLTSPGEDCIISLTSVTGKKLKIITLTREQALGFWKYDLWGQERIILSDCDIFAVDGYLDARRTGCSSIGFSVFPPVSEELLVSDETVKGFKNGIFECFSISLPEKDIKLDVEMIADNKATVGFPPALLEGINEAFLNVDYLGSVGNAFIDGKLVSDNFCNGAIWEIGLKRLMPDALGKGMYFHIIPYHKGSDVIFDKDIPFRHEFSENVTAKIYSIKCIPEYQVSFRKRLK